MLLSHETDLAGGCISDLVFDSWHAGELDPTRARELARHVATCEACARKERLFHGEAQRYRAAFEHRAELAQLGRRLKQQRRRRWLVPSTLAAAAAALLALWPATSTPATRRKGGDSVGFYVRRGDTVFRGQDPVQRVQPGDQLRFTWRSDHTTYLAILSVDAKRVVSTYYPAGESPPLAPRGAEIELASAVELDETLGRERVFVLSCDKPPPLAALRRSLAERGELGAPAGCRLQRIDLFKEPGS